MLNLPAEVEARFNDGFFAIYPNAGLFNGMCRSEEAGGRMNTMLMKEEMHVTVVKMGAHLAVTMRLAYAAVIQVTGVHVVKMMSRIQRVPHINECQGNPCHHGICTDGIASYSCSCHAGYTGSNCDKDINECASSPCQNSGVCHDYVNRYLCTCKSGYTGQNCEMDINDCASNPCQNKASCIDHHNNYTCSCTVGYTGKHCEMNIECHSNPCHNGGICTDDQTTGHTCHCPLGFTGNDCEKEPSIMIKPSVLLANSKTVLEGSSVLTILCDAEGIPIPSVTWESLETTALPHNAMQVAHYLVFTNVSTIDGGNYVCTAKNRVGIDRKVVQVIVKAKNEKPHVAPLIHAPSTIQVEYYTEARLICNVTGFPTPNVKWTRNDNPIQSFGNTLVIHSVTNATTGSYTCIATNDAGTSQANIQLKVTYDVPKIVSPPLTSVLMAGHAHNFTCIATGHPEPTIIWTYKMFTKHTTDMPSHHLLKHDTVLTLYSVTTQDSGLLTCTAKNEFGEDHVSVSVIVRSPNPVG
ncbi:uncharacterized protein [Mytilus edulis]|uniref:uncharacterized protein n=1 Tax=Mytilus edulis TaxID=6550 RepID=UPI0039F00529